MGKTQSGLCMCGQPSQLVRISNDADRAYTILIKRQHHNTVQLSVKSHQESRLPVQVARCDVPGLREDETGTNFVTGEK